MNFLTPKGFLQVGGIVLIVVGLAGFFGIIGPAPDSSLFGEAWWFDNVENWAHLVIGVVGVIAAFMLTDPNMQRQLVMVLGIVALAVGVVNFFTTSFLGANLESPADLILHLVVGAWALAASWKR
ncbi:MAG: hypothetical protein G01um1014106_389 [Parcubacteria group bacterium Gr01-1014_106]|nr:MAG: hypothetical protein G01um1014106_389 [Parcubacteria group bacterium Gr01-1014_106]